MIQNRRRYNLLILAVGGDGPSPSSKSIRSRNPLHVGLADVPDPHCHVSPCKLITGSYFGIGMVVDYCTK